MTLIHRLARAGIAAFSVLALAVEANATPMNGLPASSGINATDTIAVCQLAGGCGTSNPLVKMPMSAVLGTVGGTISGAITLGNLHNNETLPVTGKGYTITLPPATSSTLPPGSRITLSAAAGASVDVCVASGSVFDSNSSAPLSSGICASGGGVVLTGGERLEVRTESGNNYFAALSLSSSSGSANPWAVGATTTASRSLAGNDAGHVIPVDCILDDCAITLPAATFATGTQIVLRNTSNTTAVPITLVGEGAYQPSCSSGCTSTTFSYSVTNLHDAMIITAYDLCINSCTPPSVSTISDTAGNASTCSLVGGKTVTPSSGTVNSRVEQWVCPNTLATGADSWTVTLGGTGYYFQGSISEWSGMQQSSPAEQVNTGSGNSATMTLALAGNPSQRNDLIYMSAGGCCGGTLVSQQTPLPSAPNGDGYWLSSLGVGFGFTMGATNSGALITVPLVVAAYKAQAPLSIAMVTPATGISIYGAPVDSYGRIPLMPGAEVLLTLDANGNFEVQYLTPPQGVGLVDEITASSFTPSAIDCYKTNEYTAWSASQAVTIPVMVPGCVLNMIQGGSQAPKILAGGGVQLGAYPAGYQHLAGQNAAGFVQIGGGGNVATLGGQLAQ